MRQKLFLASVCASVLALVLASCSLLDGTEPTAAPTRSAGNASATPTPTPTPTDDDVLFTITAELVSPEGSTVRVVQTAHAPVPASDAARAAWASAHCEAADYDLDSPAVVRYEATAEIVSGPKPDGDYSLVVWGGGDAQHPTGYTGDLRTYQSYCADGILAMPGSGTGWTGFAGATEWTAATWGVAADDGPGEPLRVMRPDRCDLTLGPAAKGVDLPAGWDAPGPGEACVFDRDSD